MSCVEAGDTPPAESRPVEPPRLPALDALRALGAAAVLSTHVGFATGLAASPVLGGIVSRLDVGVALFFVLSGFLLFRPYAHAAAHGARRPSTRRYLWRRALRILPAYWLLVVVTLLVLPNNADAPRGDWLRYATFTEFYQRGHLWDGLGHTWSLTAEVAFYLLLPLAAALVLRGGWRPARTVILLVVGGVVTTGGWLAAMSAGWLYMGLHTMWLPAFGGWFAGGMVLATIHVAVSSGTPGRWSLLTEAGKAPLTCWALGAGLFVIASTSITGPRGLNEPTPAQFGARLILFLGVAVAVVAPAAFAAPGQFKSALSSPLARWLGTVSYGLFLWHPFVLVLLKPNPGVSNTRAAATFVGTIAGALLLASLSWYLLEQPVQRLGRRRRPRVQAGPTQHDAAPSPAGNQPPSNTVDSPGAAAPIEPGLAAAPAKPG